MTPPVELPREHGLWVMLAASLTVAVLRGPATAIALGIAATTGAVVIGAAVLVHRRIRRAPALQLAAAASLGLAGLPAELGAGGAPGPALITAATEVAIFVAGALVVRAAFARARRKAEGLGPGALGALALGLTAATALALALLGRPQAVAAAVGLVGTAGLVALRPRPRDLKSVGIGLGLVVAAASAALVLW